ncbi:hypothetical protein BvCmsKSP083_03491 [Escherichia coli]|nr:hypothetical protein BvCmsKSP027_03640 [Escherichia coli]GDL42997.1 hypothetical protein BvCmsKSP003_02318 [Escherichia coli]GDM71392.1 hypothetical protein BvCmsKSP083_03491 [Escherichia coli]GDO58064.1 hypothetical protein BvCmsNSNP029_01823 [Escherichia coli]GDO70332.1 hypothetical protein BvCmsNSNP037_02100 [Escherichia coli]
MCRVSSLKVFMHPVLGTMMPKISEAHTFMYVPTIYLCAPNLMVVVVNYISLYCNWRVLKASICHIKYAYGWNYWISKYCDTRFF